MRAPSPFTLLVLAACGSAPRAAPPPVDVHLGSTPVAPEPASVTAAAATVVAEKKTLDACLLEAFDDAIHREPDATAASKYARGRNAERANRLDEARKAYFELVQDHPRSPLVPFAYWAFAEMFRRDALKDPTKLAFAQQAYEEVLKYPGSGMHRAAASRLTEVHARMGEPERAMNALVKSLGPGTDEAQCSALVRERSLDDLVAIYPGFGSPQKADAFVRRFANDDVESVVVTMRLAEAYASAGSKDDALAALAPALARSSALVPAACLRASNIIEGAASAGAKAAAETRAALNRACQGH